jgi:uncharacterized membrane protein YhaH (DUF805 family)
METLMTFTDAVSTCFKKYATFDGIAERSEYWWFFLFCVLMSAVLGLFSDAVGAAFSIATLLPSLAVGARRLHDTDRSGWWQLLMFIPLIGWIVLIVFFAQEGKSNRYGVSSVIA